jgi:hypothetical protein
MDKVKMLSPELIEKARGDRTRQDIVTAGAGRFSEQDLYNWERGNNMTSVKKLPFLLTALGVSYDDLTVDVKIDPAA